MDSVIETELLTGGYGARMVLREFSLRVPPSSIYGFLGPNGAGKTTALRMLLGLLEPFSGEIRLFGQPIRGQMPRILRRVGSLLEQPSLYDHLTGRENLEIARLLKGAGRREAERAIEALGIGDYAGNCVREYSRGMRQRLGIAIAILGRPDLLLLDEPMNGLDSGGLTAFRSFVQELRREHGTTVVVSSHQFDEVDLIATHIGILSETGGLLFQGSRKELSDRVPQELVVKVDDADTAVEVLRAGGHTIERRRDGLVIHGATHETAREVNRLLVESGVGVHHLAIELATLQSLFVEVTGAGKAWADR